MEKSLSLKPISATKKYKREWIRENRKTFLGYSRQVYAKQRSVSKRRKMEGPKYTLQEFQDWLRGQDVFWELFKKWKETGNRQIAPSVDRKDPQISYILENLQVITLYDNLYVKGFQERTEAIKTWQRSEAGQSHLKRLAEIGSEALKKSRYERDVICISCFGTFIARSPKAIYCSNACGKRYRKRHTKHG